MDIKTALVAWNCRLREWAGMIQDCKRHPEDMSVKQWCDAHSITVANYYYQMKEVRKPLLMRSVECWLHTKPAAVPKVINGRLCFSGIMRALNHFILLSNVNGSTVSKSAITSKHTGWFSNIWKLFTIQNEFTAIVTLCRLMNLSEYMKEHILRRSFWQVKMGRNFSF